MTDQVLLADQGIANRHDSLRADRLHVRFKPTRRMRLRARGICDSPSTMVPSVNSAHNTTSWAADGSTRPRMFSTLLVSFTALSRSPVTPARLAMNRLPNAWPSSAPPWKRYSNSWVWPGGRRAPAMARTVPCRPANTASNPPPMNATPSQLGDSAPRLQVSTATARRNIENSIQPSGRTLTMSRTPADSNTMPAAINTTQRFTPSPGASHWARRRSLVGTGLLLPDVAMLDRDAVAPAGTVVCQCIRQHHRTMVASGAPERHRPVGLALFHILRQQIVHQLGQVAHELLRRGGVEHKAADLRAVAGQGAQRLVVVRVGQESHVEHEVGVERNAIFVPKREHGDGERDRVWTAHERVHDRVAQFAYAEGGRVDDLVGFLFHGLQPAPLGPDAVHDAARLGQGMLAARLLETADQHIVGRIEEEDDIVQPHRLQGVQRGDQIIEKLPPARVDGQRRALDTTFRLHAEFGELRQQRGRQVVHAEEAEVLKHLHGVRLPRAGEPGNDDKLEVGDRPQAPHRRWPGHSQPPNCRD